MELNDGIADRFFPPEMRAVCPILQAVPIKVCVFGKKIGLTMLLLLLLLLLLPILCVKRSGFCNVYMFFSDMFVLLLLKLTVKLIPL